MSTARKISYIVVCDDKSRCVPHPEDPSDLPAMVEVAGPNKPIAHQRARTAGWKITKRGKVAQCPKCRPRGT